MDSGLIKFLAVFPALLFAAILHEIAHGYVAEKLGDPTARSLGRISLNPIKHIDLFLTIILPALLIFSGSPVIFGGAKPVPVNPGFFKNPRKGMAVVAAAGPITNIILAFIGFLVLLIFWKGGIAYWLPQTVAIFINLILFQWVLINIVLAFFNLFPVPPLDGGRIVSGLLPIAIARPYAKLERFGLPLVFLLLYGGIISSYLNPIIDFSVKFLQTTVLPSA